MLALLGTAFAADILFFYDDPSSSSTETSDLIDALEDAGHTVTEVNENSWSNSPAVSGFDVVIHQNGANQYGIDMPTAGQTALASWVEAGGGYIGTAWASWEEDNRSHYASMSDLILLDHSNGDRCSLSVTYSPASSYTSHPLATGLTSGFTFFTCADQGSLKSFGTDPAFVVFEESSYDAVIAREWGDGRVVNFSFAPNYSSGAPLSDSNVQQLYLNAVDWVENCDDVDGDGVTTCDNDCDDNDSDTYPGAASNDSSTDCMTDADGDGYGDDNPATGVTAGTDCDDSDSSVNAGATETVADGIDQDCDAVDTCYGDGDGDGYGSTSTVDDDDLDCTNGSNNESDVDTDCDDSDANTFPGAAPFDSTTDCMNDDDGDDYGDSTVSTGVTAGTDCDDNDTTVYSGATETVADGIDQDCDAVDTCYEDDDGDGYGSTSTVDDDDLDCTNGSNDESDVDTDCDDSDANTFPGAAPFDSTTDCMNDDDGDDYGDVTVSTGVTAGTDCDDTDSSTYLGADEYCDGHDDDCDGTVDEDDALDAQTWYADTDSDGFGDASSTDIECYVVSGYVADSTDCDDTDDDTFPGSAPNDSSTDCMRDADGDDYGDASASGSIVPGLDCDDADPAIHPAAEDIPYDTIDQDCDGEDECDVDDDGYVAVECEGDDCDDEDEDIHVDADERWYDGIDQNCDEASDYDADADGFDSASYGGDDCDDANPETYPGAPDDVGDGIINDCDDTDEYDEDGDGFAGVDYGGDDCDDANSSVNPDAEEVWYDGVDQDCDGNDDDQDEDGFEQELDCDDTDPDVYPGAPGWTDDCEPWDSGIADTGLAGDKGGCGCASPGGPGLLIGLVGLVSVLRRRRAA